MKTSIQGRAIIIVMVFFLLLTSGVFSLVSAQPSKETIYEKEHPISQAHTAGKDINHHDDVNLFAVAEPLNKSINSPFVELKPALAPNGNRLYFSRHLHPDNLNADDLEDIWFSDYNPKTNKWSDPALLTGHLNNAGPNYINNISVTGDTVILGNQYHKRGKMTAGISYSVNIDGTWSAPINIEIKNDYNIAEQGSAFVSVKHGVIIQAIQRVETYGARDLYVSFWDGHRATEPVNMGSVINTDLEESSPFLDADNKSLYFASKGRNGYGGYDIWVSERLDDTWLNWSEPRNLGPAVNGQLDEEFFSITHCGNYGIFSKQVSVHNVNLYRISTAELFNKETPTEVAPSELGEISMFSPEKKSAPESNFKYVTNQPRKKVRAGVQAAIASL
jgi:OOP family OmpA-OmpF porin